MSTLGNYSQWHIHGGRNQENPGEKKGFQGIWGLDDGRIAEHEGVDQTRPRFEAPGATAANTASGYTDSVIVFSGVVAIEKTYIADATS